MAMVGVDDSSEQTDSARAGGLGLRVVGRLALSRPSSNEPVNSGAMTR